MTCDTWHVTHGGGWTFSKNFSSLAHMVWEIQCKGSMNELMSDGGDCRTAPATPGLLIISYIGSAIILWLSLMYCKGHNTNSYVFTHWFKSPWAVTVVPLGVLAPVSISTVFVSPRIVRLASIPVGESFSSRQAGPLPPPVVLLVLVTQTEVCCAGQQVSKKD